MMKVKIAQEYQSFEGFVYGIEEVFSQSGEVITAKRNVIKIIEHLGKKVVVKSFKVPNWINQFAYRFIRDSKAKRSFDNAQKLIELGINTPKPIAYIEEFRPLLGESFYICEYFDYDFEIRDVLKDKDFIDRDSIFEAFAKFSFFLHEKGVYHIDYSPGNVLIKKDKEGYIFTIVDVNRMKFMTFDDESRFKNLSRFSASKEDTIAIAKAYAEVSGIEESFAIERLCFYHQAHQNYLRNKKKLKSL